MKFTVRYRTLGMNLCAGELEAISVDTIKEKCTSLLTRRRIRSLEAADVIDSNGKVAAILNMHAYMQYRTYEWATIRN